MLAGTAGVNGMFTISAVCPSRISAAFRPAACDSAPPVTNGICTVAMTIRTTSEWPDAPGIGGRAIFSDLLAQRRDLSGQSRDLGRHLFVHGQRGAQTINQSFVNRALVAAQPAERLDGVDVVLRARPVE